MYLPTSPLFFHLTLQVHNAWLIFHPDVGRPTGFAVSLKIKNCVIRRSESKVLSFCLKNSNFAVEMYLYEKTGFIL